MSKKPEDKKPSDTDRAARANRFTETGAGVRIIRPGKGEVDLRSIPPRINEKD